MDDAPVSLSEARWDRCSRVEEQTVVDLLRAVLAKIERGEIKPDHAFLCLGEVVAYRGVSSQWMQAGGFNVYAQIGLLERCKTDLLNSAVSS